MSHGFNGSVVQRVERRLVTPETQVQILPLPLLLWHLSEDDLIGSSIGLPELVAPK
jgi:hypothetical protein